jgi:hypothetical protein
MTNQYGRLARLDPECCVALDSDAGLAKVHDTETGEYVWARIPKNYFAEHRERLQERADGGRRALPGVRVRLGDIVVSWKRWRDRLRRPLARLPPSKESPSHSAPSGRGPRPPPGKRASCGPGDTRQDVPTQ